MRRLREEEAPTSGWEFVNKTVRNLRNITIAYISQGPEGLYYKNLYDNNLQTFRNKLVFVSGRLQPYSQTLD